MHDLWPWLTLVLLGTYHGLNPGMGWLFAVALGLQERRRSAVLRALPPIALGHGASVALILTLVGGAALVLDPRLLRIGGAAALILFGMFRLLRQGAHPKWVGFRVGARDLTVWSFLMSTAHGAGLMLFPVTISLGSGHAMPTMPAGDTGTTGMATGAASAGYGLLAVAVHTVVMLTVMALVALLVYEKLGVGILRKAWLNLDTMWAATLIVVGVVTLAT